MSDEKSESVTWSMFKEMVVSFTIVLGFVWVLFSSSLMITMVLRVIFR